MTAREDFFSNRKSINTGRGGFKPSTNKYTLSDLREDEEFNKVTERFLKSIGEGDSTSDLFAYFRGSDYNLAQGLSVLAQSKKFNEQQKLDYQYLRRRFDNADMGGFGEWASGIGSIVGDVVSDPTVLASLLFVPWTGGASAATRLAGSKVVQSGLKKLTNKEIAEATAKGISKLPGQKLKKPLSKTTQTALASTEGFLYGSTNNATTQNIDINTDRRQNYSLGETLGVGALGAALPAVIRGVGIGASKGYNKFTDSVQKKRANRIDGGEDYKLGIYDKGIEAYDSVIDNFINPVAKYGSIATRYLIEKPTSRFVEKMKLDKGLDKLIKIFRYDTGRTISAKGFDAKMPVSERSYFELVNLDIGTRNEILTKALEPLYKTGAINVPTINSRDAFFKVPGKVKKYFGFEDVEKTKKSFRSDYDRISDETNDALAYYLRTGRKTKTIDGKRINIIDAFNVTENTIDEIVTAGNTISTLMKEIRNDAVSKGLKIGRVNNYLPRGWRYNRVQDELDNFVENGVEGALIKELKAKYPRLKKTVKKKSGQTLSSEEQIINLLEDLVDPMSPASKSWVELATEGKGKILQKAFMKKTPSLTKERKLSLLDETVIDDYLDNSVQNLVSDYIHQSAAFIRRKELLGEDLAEFVKKHINPIQQRLKAKGKDKKLTGGEFGELEQLKNLYLITTGQVARPSNKAASLFNDIAIVGNQLALLPFATITSLSEVAVPLVKGAGRAGFKKAGKDEPKLAQGGVRTLWETANDYRKMWWNDVWTKELKDARPEALRELNRFNRAMGQASQDRALAMFGQGFSRRATRAQNLFFKYNLLHDWTRFVQLTSFNVGKSKIYENLHQLATNKTLGKLSRNLSDKQKIRLENELKELGVDVTAGIKWVQSGGKSQGKFYNESLLPSAARYVDEVIMNPTAAANQKPLLHSMPSTRWAFGLLGFPTAFGNTVLKNALREVNKDVRQGDFKKSGQMAAGITTMIGIAMFGNTIRSRGTNLERIQEGESTIGEEVKDAAIRAGLLGPTEYAYRVTQSRQYDNLIKSLLGRFTGPAVNDILNLLEDWNGPLSVFIDKIPGISAYRAVNPEGFKELKKLARAADKAAGTTATGKKKKEVEQLYRSNFTEGGFVEGVQDVPFTKENPADRVNPYTGEPYSGLVLEDFPLLNRLPMNEGGLTDEEKARIDADIEMMGGVRSGQLQSSAPVIELLVGGNTAKIIAGIGKDGYKLVDNLLKNSKRVPKPSRYYHGSTLKLKEVTPMADRVDPKLQNMFQAASYIGKPTEGGLDIANYYARGGGFVNIIDEKVFDKIVKKLYNPRNISDDVLKNINKEITTRKNLIDFAKRTNTRKNLGKFRKELVDLENLVKPYGSGYISKVSPVQRKVLKREGFDGIDISDDVIAVFDKLPVRRAARGSLTDKLLKRRQLKELEKAQLKKGN